MKICLRCGQRFKLDAWLCPNCGWAPEVHNGYISFLPDIAETSTGFDVKYFSQLAKIEEGNFWFRSRNRLILWVLNRNFPTARNFLEIGCGTGFVLSGIHKEFPDMSLSGSDIFCEGLDYAKTRVPSATFLQIDARRIPFEEEFDIIGAFDILEHIEEDTLVLKQMFNAVKKKGGVILTVPQHKWLWSAQDEIAFHRRRYSRIELEKKMRDAGFQIVFRTSFLSLLLPAMVLSRFRSHFLSYSNKPNNAIRELQINPIINRIFEKICNIERSILKKGISLPAGGSLLCVGRKD